MADIITYWFLSKETRDLIYKQMSKIYLVESLGEKEGAILYPENISDAKLAGMDSGPRREWEKLYYVKFVIL